MGSERGDKIRKRAGNKTCQRVGYGNKADLSCSHGFWGSGEGPDAGDRLRIQRKHNSSYIRDNHFALQMIDQK
jgi:hypothetical protein